MGVQDEPDDGCKDCRSYRDTIDNLYHSLYTKDLKLMEVSEELSILKNQGITHVTVDNSNCTHCFTYASDMKIAYGQINELKKQVATRDTKIKELEERCANLRVSSAEAQNHLRSKIKELETEWLSTCESAAEHDAEYVRELERVNQVLVTTNDKQLKMLKQISELVDKELYG